MKCEYCENEVPVGVSRCPSCGATVKFNGEEVAVIPPKTCEEQRHVSTLTENADPPLTHKRKMKTVYVVLGFFFGEIGIHNFYAGYKRRAIVQLLITLLSFGSLLLVSWIWAIIEIIIVTDDASGHPFI